MLPSRRRGRCALAAIYAAGDYALAVSPSGTVGTGAARQVASSTTCFFWDRWVGAWVGCVNLRTTCQYDDRMSNEAPPSTPGVAVRQ